MIDCSNEQDGCKSVPCCSSDPSGAMAYRADTPVNCVPVPTVAFSPLSGTTQSFPVTVTLEASRTDALIYYTVDGSTPTINSTPYTTPFELADPNAVVQAMAIVTGCDSGSVNIAQYIAMEEDMPLNSAVYEPGLDKIFAVGGGYVYRFSSSGIKEARSKFVASAAFSDTYVVFCNDFVYISVWKNDNESNYPTNTGTKLLFKVDPATLAVTSTLNFKPDFIVSYQLKPTNNWVEGPREMFVVGTNIFGRYLRPDFSSELWKFDTVAGVFSNPGGGLAENSNGYVQQGLVYDADNDLAWLTWYNGSESFDFGTGFSGTKVTLAGDSGGGSLVPRGVEYHNGLLYFTLGNQGTGSSSNIAKRAITDADPTTLIDLGNALAAPRKIRFNSVDGLLYVPDPETDTIFTINPTNDTVSAIAGSYDSPWDVVFTPTKKFVVQHGSVGLKEIV